MMMPAEHGERAAAEKRCRSLENSFRVAIVSCYEGGLQPTTALSTASFLRKNLVDASVFDLYVRKIDCLELNRFQMIVFIVPLYESIKDSVGIAKEIFERKGRPAILFCGSYAELVANEIIGQFADGVVFGDWEEEIVQLVQEARKKGSISFPEKVIAKRRIGSRRVPLDRSLGPNLKNYSYSEAQKRIKPEIIVGPVEVSRGCRFRCRYCSVYAVSDGKAQSLNFRNVCQDIDSAVDGGAEHICFVDADFFNVPKVSLAAANYLAERHPTVTFDITTRADLIVEYADELEQLARRSLNFVTTAFEFPNDVILKRLNKGFNVDKIKECISESIKREIQLNPTFLVFNPWIVAEDLTYFEYFLRDNNLEQNVAPIQYRTRLWLYKGSPLLEDKTVQESIIEEHQFHFEWRSKDPRVEEVYDAWAFRERGMVEKRCCLKC